jgi:glycosyltransferase involved in cell wall biosynthesis
MVFTTSNYTLRSVVEDYDCDSNKVTCVYSGMNIKVEFRAGQKDYSNKDILFVGVDWERKGGPELVQAFKLVLKAHPEARLTIVGCSPALDVSNCHVVGLIPPEEVRQYFAKSSVFCLPSKIEPSAVALTEASAHALPVVSTGVGGTSDRVLHGETGYLIQPGDVEGCAITG